MIEGIADVERAVGADYDPMRTIQPRLGCGATVASRALTPACHSGDHAGLGIDAPDGVVLGIDNKQVPGFVARRAFGTVKRRLKGRTTIAGVALLARPGNRGNDALLIDLADAVALALDDIDEIFVAADRACPKDLCLCRQAAIARVRPLTRPCKDLRCNLIRAEAVDQAGFHIGDIEPAAITRSGNIVGFLKDKVSKLSGPTDFMAEAMGRPDELPQHCHGDQILCCLNRIRFVALVIERGDFPRLCLNLTECVYPGLSHKEVAFFIERQRKRILNSRVFCKAAVAAVLGLAASRKGGNNVHAVLCPMSSYFVAGGNLAPDAPCYVKRQADDALLAALLAREFSYVLDTRQVGKSSLMVRAAAQLRRERVRVAILDLTGVGQNVSPEQWYSGLLAQLGAALNLEDALENFAEAHPQLGPAQRFFAAIREIALPAAGPPLTLFVDEIDAVRSLPFPTDEFFSGVRACYNRRADDPELKRLTFCLLGSATPDSLVRDARVTPFNIGQRIEPTDFTLLEARPLAEGFGEGGMHAIERILHWTDGHPYLTQRLCQAVAEVGHCDNGSVDRAVARLFFHESAREEETNLSFVQRRLLEGGEDVTALLELYRRTRRREVKEEAGSPLVAVLKLSGIVRSVRGQLRVRNRIYARVFDEAWINRSIPDGERQRQRAAFLRGLLPTALVGTAGLIATGLLTLRSVRAEQEATRSLNEVRLREQRWKEALEALANERANRSTADATLLKLAEDRLLAAQEENSELRRRLHIPPETDLRLR